MNTKRCDPYLFLEAFHPGTNELNVVVETPKGSRNKYEYDAELGLFKLGGLLPAGANFPFDFGFVPSTLGEDGDPLDVLVLMDEPAFSGCLVASRLIGVIEAEQTERNGKTVRNDRLIAVAVKSLSHRDLISVEQLQPSEAGSTGGSVLLEEVEHFFASYNNFKGKEFHPIGRFGPERAQQLIELGVDRMKQTLA